MKHLIIRLFKRDVNADFIQFHFCLKGSSELVFNEGAYKLSLSQGKSLLLYNPQRTLPINLSNNTNSKLLFILISIKKFHLLFSDEASYITFLSKENVLKKYYTEETISPFNVNCFNSIVKF